MPIQYQCPGCSQPIEVDEEFAGRTAACPYCGRVGTVPEQSTHTTREAVTARPAGRAGEAGAPAGDALPPNRMGYAALGCAGAAVALFMGTIVYVSLLLFRDLKPTPTSQPTREELNAAVQRFMGAHPGVGLSLMASLAVAAVGAALAVASLRQRPRRNWPARISLAVCGLMLVCALSDVLFQVVCA